MAKRWDPGNHENELRLPEKDHGWIKESVVIPDGVLRSLPGGKVDVTVTFFKTIHKILPNAGNMTYLGSHVCAVSVNEEVSNLSSPFTLRFKLQSTPTPVSKTCGYWNFSGESAGKWDNAGCKLVSEENDEIVCQCDHMTNFAILVSPHIPDKDSPHGSALSHISLVGCGVSVFCLLIVVIIYAVAWSNVGSGFATMLVNLCVALILANTIFIFGADKTESEACMAIAIIMHYLYLSVFFFMLGEAFELFLSTVLIFHHHTLKEKVAIVLASWGIPIIIVAIAVGITGGDGYGHKLACWLSPQSGLLWAFVGPIIAIIVLNLIFMSVVLWNIWESRSRRNEATRERLRASVLNVVVLTPLFGFSWVFGMFAVNEDTLTFQYIFTIVNSLQGVAIFICHGVMNKKVRGFYGEKLNRIMGRKSTKYSRKVAPSSSSGSSADLYRGSNSMMTTVST